MAVAQHKSAAAHDAKHLMHTVLADNRCHALIEHAQYGGHRPAGGSGALLLEIVQSPSKGWTPQDQQFVMDCKRKLDLYSLTTREQSEDADGVPPSRVDAARVFLAQLHTDMCSVLQMQYKGQSTTVRLRKERRAGLQDAAQRTRVRMTALSLCACCFCLWHTRITALLCRCLLD